MLADMAVPDDQGDRMTCRIMIEDTALAVRDGLKNLLATSVLRELPPETQGHAEIVLAEVLNNVVEHGYAKHRGQTEVIVNRLAGGISVSVTDSGLPFPGGALPQGTLPDCSEGPALPEGGFGWHLIRALTNDLTYRRCGNKNHLQFIIALPEPP